MELVYSVLKVLSMLAGAAFGILALLTKYKDDRGRITKWGKIAIGGILISLGISLVLYAFETSKAKAGAIKAKAEADATKQRLETIIATALETAKQQQRSLEETEKLKTGLEESMKTSKEIAQRIKEEGEAAKEQSNQLLGAVERTIHPLFPLEVRVKYGAPLRNKIAAPLYKELNAQLKTWEESKPWPPQSNHSADRFPSGDRQPLVHGIVTADVHTWIRFYTRSKTERLDFTEDDLNFCYCPGMYFSNPSYDERQTNALFSDSPSEYERYMVSHRKIDFRSDGGFQFDDGINHIDLTRANANRGFMSADDLYGATIQIELSPLVKIHQKDGPVASFPIRLEGLELKLPGNRSMWIQGDKFSKAQGKEKLLYRFTFPISRVGFNKLLY